MWLGWCRQDDSALSRIEVPSSPIFPMISMGGGGRGIHHVGFSPDKLQWQPFVTKTLAHLLPLGFGEHPEPATSFMLCEDCHIRAQTL